MRCPDAWVSWTAWVRLASCPDRPLPTWPVSEWKTIIQDRESALCPPVNCHDTPETQHDHSQVNYTVFPGLRQMVNMPHNLQHVCWSESSINKNSSLSLSLCSLYSTHSELGLLWYKVWPYHCVCGSTRSKNKPPSLPPSLLPITSHATHTHTLRFTHPRLKVEKIKKRIPLLPISPLYNTHTQPAKFTEMCS